MRVGTARIAEVRKQEYSQWLSTPERKCSDGPEQKCITEGCQKAPHGRIFISVSNLGLVVGQLSCLWLALTSLALLQPIAVAVHFEDVDVVGQPVE